LRKPRLERLKVFEGAAHPYKRNLIKFDGGIRDEEPVGEEGAREKTSA